MRETTRVTGFERALHGGLLSLMATVDSWALASDAGLRYVDTGSPGYRRVRRGRGFSYLGEDGAPVNGSVRERIRALAIPPAWDDVWICRDPSGHILATGHDKAGRKQYIYHPCWEETRDEAKFDRLAPFGRGLTGLRKSIDADLRSHGLSRTKVVALAVAVLDRTLVRVGNRRYADNEAYGLTTLTCDHIQVDGLHVHLEFAGKGGADHLLVFKDRRLSGLIAKCEELSGQTLFSYQAEDGAVSSVTSNDVNDYLATVMRGPFTAKDFRTWGASSLVTGELASPSGPDDPDARLTAAIDMAAERLGNTRAVCRDSYVHPVVVEADADGRLAEAWKRSRGGKWANRSESTLRRLLDPAR